MSNFGVLGGTFDPPHLGHLLLAQEVYAQFSLDQVWLMPTGDPPHKGQQNVTPWVHRHAMVQLAVQQDSRFACTDIEHLRSGLSYTVDSLRQLRSEWGQSAHIYLILGWDMLLTLPEWHDASGVVALADVIVAARRPGYSAAESDLTSVFSRLPQLQLKIRIVTMPQIEIAASSVRDRVFAGMPIRYYVPDTVREYIETNGLYTRKLMTIEMEKE